MNQEVIQLAAREEAWVPKADKVKISTNNMRIDPTMTQKERLTKSFIVTKIKDTNFYEFKLANKKCLVDVDVFRQALDICPRVPEKEFIVPLSEEELLTFLIGLGYKGELTHLPQMFIDHMHQPWRTISSIINKCLSGKTTSNDRLRQSRVAIIWGMFHKKYVDFAELIWEDFSYQIDNRHLPSGLINQGLWCSEQNEVLSGTYRRRSRNMVEQFQMQGKGSQGKKSAVTPKPASIEVSDSKPARRRTSSRRIYKKKVSISADDNIIPEPDVTLELGKSISLTEKTIGRKSNRIQPHARGSSERTGTKPGVPDESTVILTPSSERTEEESVYSKEENVDKEFDWVYFDEEEEKKDDDKNDVDKEMKDAKVAESEKGDEEITNMTKANAKKSEKVKDDNKKAELPLSSSSLSVFSDPLPAIIQRVFVLEKAVQKIKEVDHTTTHLALLRSEILSAVNAYLGSSLGDALQKSVQENVINEVKNLLPKFLPKAVSDFATLVIQSTAAESLFEYALKKILFEKMDKSRSYLTHDMHRALFDVLFNSLCLDDVVARGQADPEKILKKEIIMVMIKTKTLLMDQTRETSKGNAPTKGSKSDKSIHVEESVAEPTEDVIIDASNDDVVNDADQPQHDPAPKHNWFTQSPRLPTPDPEWNKGKAIDDSQEYTWFNDLLSTEKGPLMFDELMATLMNFSKFAMNRLKIDKLTKAHLVSPVYNLLKGTCQSSIELEYNMEECYKELSDQLY
ncbi:hypothetical protein Tco_1418804 [Tanacetum coccineum]